MFYLFNVKFSGLPWLPFLDYAAKTKNPQKDYVCAGCDKK